MKPTEIEHKGLTSNIFSLRFWIKNTEPELLKNVFNNLLFKTDYKILDFSEYFFPVQGYTAIWLLAESHLAVHTFPKEGWSYIELSGCNKNKTDKFREEVSELSFEISWETERASKSSPKIPENSGINNK